MNEDVKKEMIIRVIEKTEIDPFLNLTVSDVAKDLKIGMNNAYRLFLEPDFPAINIGRIKTITYFAYILWKMERRNLNA